jgi:hypothetical protein
MIEKNKYLPEFFRIDYQAVIHFDDQYYTDIDSNCYILQRNLLPPEIHAISTMRSVLNLTQ